MRWSLTWTLLAAAAWPAVAEENEAEKLFRGMEQKVRKAKTLQVRFDLSVTDALGKKGTVQGILTLGEGDRYRVDGEGKLFGEAVKFTEVCDGTTTSFRDPNDPKKDSNEPAPKAAGAYFRAALPRWGFFLSTLNMRRSGELTPDAFQLSDFKPAAPEKIGGRNAQVIQFTFKEKGAKDGLSMKMWLDAETNLPVKLTVAGGKSDWADIAETYREFTIDPRVDAKLFELPK
jgi:outer membrane lipoprotein-sorting protein